MQQSYLKDREAANATTTNSTATASTTETGAGDASSAGGTAPKDPKAAAVVAVRPTKLFSTNKDVDTFNATELAKLAACDAVGDVQRYEAIDEGKEPFLNQLRQGTKAPATLELRVGAQVRGLSHAFWIMTATFLCSAF